MPPDVRTDRRPAAGGAKPSWPPSRPAPPCSGRKIECWNSAQQLLSHFEGELVSAPGPDGRRTILPRLLDLTHQAHPATAIGWCLTADGRRIPGERDA